MTTPEARSRRGDDNATLDNLIGPEDRQTPEARREDPPYVGRGEDDGGTLIEQESKGTEGKMRVVLDMKPAERTALHTATGITGEKVMALSAVASDQEGHLVEVQVAAMGGGDLNIVVLGRYELRKDHQGNLLILAWPSAHAIPVAPYKPTTSTTTPTGPVPKPSMPEMEK